MLKQFDNNKEDESKQDSIVRQRSNRPYDWWMTPLCNKLLQVVLRSKQFNNREMDLAASNAITLLNQARVTFSGLDLSGIRIPNADLCYSICDSTDFSGADLSGVKFRKAWLKNAVKLNVFLSSTPVTTQIRKILTLYSLWIRNYRDMYLLPFG